MKTLSLFLFFNIPIILFGQSVPQISQIITQLLDADGNWKTNSIESFEYDEEERLFQRVTRRYNPEINDMALVSRISYEYDEVGEIKKTISERIDTLQIWKKSTVKTYEYNIEGCLEKYITHFYNGEQISQTINEYKYLDNCLVDSFLVWEKLFSIDAISPDKGRLDESTKYRYENNGLRVIEDLTEYGFNGNYYSTENYRVSEYDAAGNKVTLIYTGSLKTESEYYPDGELKSQKIYDWINEEWSYSHTILRELKTDENGFLVRETLNLESPSSAFSSILSTHNFENYCDGLIRTKFNASQKKIYEYTLASDCYDSSQGDINMLVYPNPATNFIQLYSEALRSGELTVSIYDSKGSMVFRKEMEGRSEGLLVSVNEYSSGLYFINLTGLGKTKTVKFLVER